MTSYNNTKYKTLHALFCANDSSPMLTIVLNRKRNVYVYPGFSCALVERYRDCLLLRFSRVRLRSFGSKADDDGSLNIEEELSAHIRRQSIHIITKLLYNNKLHKNSNM